MAEQIPEDVRQSLDKAEAEVQEHETKVAAKTDSLLARLAESNEQVFDIPVWLRATEGDPQKAFYGKFSFRRWTAGEVFQILGTDVYQKANRTEMKTTAAGETIFIPAPPLTADEHRRFFEMACDMIARAATKEQGLTKEKLVELGNWPWVKFVFSVVAGRSGMDSSIEKDLMDFFRDEDGREPRKAPPRGAQDPSQRPR